MSKKSRERVLVLGSDTRSFLSVVRSLGRQGLEVHSAWSTAGSPATRSRYIHRQHSVPLPGDAAGNWLPALLALVDRYRFRLVIPCNDPSLIPLHENRHRLREPDRFYLLNEAAYRVAFDKPRMCQLAQRCHVPTPAERRVDAPADAQRAVEQLGLPLILKPTESYRRDRLDKKRHVEILDSADAVGPSAARLLRGGPAVAQAFCPGRGVGIEFLAWQGKIRFAFQHERVHEPHTGGGSSYRRSCEIHPELMQYTQRMVTALEYSGVGMAEFRWDPLAERAVFLELNARFWGSLPLALAAGADFPWYLYQMLVLGRLDFPQTYRRDIYCRNWLLDLQWQREDLQQAGGTKSKLIRFARQRAGDLWNLTTLRERSDTLAADDPIPALVEMTEFARHVGRRMVDKVQQRWLRSRPVRSRHASRLRQAVRQAGTIAFVCKGNICRSPFAEQWARNYSKTSCTFLSGGYYPVKDRACPEEAIQAAEEWQLDLREHRSQVVSPRWLERADVVLTFDEENYAYIKQQFPELRGRVHRLGVLTETGDPAIRDPYGSTLESFRRTYARIAAALDVLFGTSAGRQRAATTAPLEHNAVAP